MKGRLGVDRAGSAWGAEPNHLTHLSKLGVTLSEGCFKQHMVIGSKDSARHHKLQFQARMCCYTFIDINFQEATKSVAPLGPFLLLAY